MLIDAILNSFYCFLSQSFSVYLASSLNGPWVCQGRQIGQRSPEALAKISCVHLAWLSCSVLPLCQWSTTKPYQKVAVFAVHESRSFRIKILHGIIPVNKRRVLKFRLGFTPLSIGGKSIAVARHFIIPLQKRSHQKQSQMLAVKEQWPKRYVQLSVH